VGRPGSILAAAHHLFSANGSPSSAKEYVRQQAHTNGMESFWAMLKRGYQGTFHKFSEKHLDRYVGEFAARHNARQADAADQMEAASRSRPQSTAREEPNLPAMDNIAGRDSLCLLLLIGPVQVLLHRLVQHAGKPCGSR